LNTGIIGGGAAGTFAAIFCAEANRTCRVTLMEAATRTLAKVRISGGGRCNVTTSVLDPRELIGHYPRGGRELLGPFTRFGPRETCAWFEARGVRLKTEPDGRVFPLSDSAETVTGCLEQAALQAGVRTVTRAGVRGVGRDSDGRFTLQGREGDVFDRILVATGSAEAGYHMARQLGHTLVPCVPSLFSFEIQDARLAGLQGVSVPQARVRLSVGDRPLEHLGPVLITHWGLSGPAVLKLSAWGARQLAERNYKGSVQVDWVPQQSEESLMDELKQRRAGLGKAFVLSDNPTSLPQRLWTRLAHHAGISSETTWSGLTREATEKLLLQLKSARFAMSGRGEFKEEFVTAGGVELKEVDFRSMQSKVCPGVYFAGEVLDIDGLTGGFNLQCAWTTGQIAGCAMAQSPSS